MPPKAKFTKQQIIETAVEITRKSGMENLTARSLACALGTSPKPIFGLFQNMQEVQQAVIASAQALYRSYLQKGMAEGKYPPYKASGMAYIRFAQEEKELFKLLYMRDRSSEAIEENRDEIRPQLEILMTTLSLSEEEACLLHMQLWIFVHGIATMLATSYLNWSEDFISRALTDAYEGLKLRRKYGEHH